MRKIIETNSNPATQKTRITKPLRHLRYFILSMVAILLSLIFPIAEWQFLTLSIITGIKWIADSRSMVITIIERGWKQW